MSEKQVKRARRAARLEQARLAAIKRSPWWHRMWRLGQILPIRAIFPVHTGTTEEGLKLMDSKMKFGTIFKRSPWQRFVGWVSRTWTWIRQWRAN